jgi:hypothetical protein
LFGFEVKFVDFGQPHGDQDGIHGKGFVGAGNRLPTVVQFGNRDPRHMPVTMGGHHGMRGKNGDAQPYQLVRMHLFSI